MRIFDPRVREKAVVVMRMNINAEFKAAGVLTSQLIETTRSFPLIFNDPGPVQSLRKTIKASFGEENTGGAG